MNTPLQIPCGGSVAPGQPRLCYIVTHAISTNFLRGQIAFMRAQGFQVTLITSPGKELDDVREERPDIICVPMEREIRIVRDLWSLVRIYRVLRDLRPDIVNASTPKAGLLGMLAAFAARVPVRIYTLRGLRLQTTRGWKRRLLMFAERIASACAHRVICISPSLAKEYVRLALTTPSKTVVFGSGSSNGIDVRRYEPTRDRSAQGARVRASLGIQPSDPVIGFAGRIARDKGIQDLLHAYWKLRERVPNAWLLLVGDVDATDPPHPAVLQAIRSDPRIHVTGFVADVIAHYHAMNLLAFPSYREGFGNAAMEGQAAGLPVVGYRATGVVDAVLDGVTGCLVPIGDVEQLAAALARYVTSPELAWQHGRTGCERVRREFSQIRIWNALLEEYEEFLGKAEISQEPPATHVLSDTQAA